MAEIGLREHGHSRLHEPLVFTEAEAAAWPARHLDDAGLRLTTIWITLAGTIELEGPPARRRTRDAEATLVQSRVGSLSIPGWLLTSIMGAVVERVEVGEGRLTIKTREPVNEPRRLCIMPVRLHDCPMADAAGTRFVSLLSLMARLRAEGGCPWDREQTRTSLRPYVIEEAYEVVQAIDEGSRDHLVEELGDLLFQVVFHSQLGAEAGEFTMEDVVERVCDKMTRRHPHVFGDRVVADSREALAQWERIKQEETGSRGSVLDGVPASLPALLRAQRLQTKAARVGFDWTGWQDAWSKVREEVGEVQEALTSGDDARVADELGDLLFSIVNVARLRGMDAEDCLRRASEKFTRRFGKVEAEMKAGGRTVTEASAEDLDRAWEAAKAQERQGRPESGMRS